jgi:hypothetical protein
MLYLFIKKLPKGHLRAAAIVAHAQGRPDRATNALQEALAIAQALHLVSEQKDIEAVLQAG